MSNIVTNDNRVAKKLRFEKETIITNFRNTHLGSAKEDSALDVVKNLFMNTITSKVTTQSYPDGSTYEGHIHMDGQRTAKGILYLSNGDVYAGDWKDGNFHGFGTYIFANGER
jgi:hypothetical protein